MPEMTITNQITGKKSTAWLGGIVILAEISDVVLEPEALDDAFDKLENLKEVEWLPQNGLYVFTFETTDLSDAYDMHRVVVEYLHEKAGLDTH